MRPLRQNARWSRLLLITSLAIATGAVSLPSRATPLQPNVRKMLRQQQDTNYPAARAGWDGPELKSRAQQPPNPVMEMFGPAAVQRAMRASLVAAALPDWRIIGSVLLVILLLRRMHRRNKLPRAEVGSDAVIQRPSHEAELPRGGMRVFRRLCRLHLPAEKLSSVLLAGVLPAQSELTARKNQPDCK